ncbi:hypothetical protein [Mycolicibacterium fortuitum]|uniref:hypothetical protein n=1 Tax=Mycolicibacterium fortuitum TaxID=1766 RepID=UPI0007EA7DE7|nr:hypothetical protein [Mycolicibacterium fortuitum]OBG50180.1 hypothetical protein A5670_26420 [Mycolicibacterium fortuitum]
MTTTEPATTDTTADTAVTASAETPPVTPPAEDTTPPTTEAPATEAQTAETGTEVRAEADTDDSRTDAQIGREAAKYRVRLRETETKLTEADTARQAAEQRAEAAEGQLTQQRQAIVDAALTAAGLDPALLTAAGHAVDDLLDDGGMVDNGKLTEAVSDAMARFNVQPRSRGPQPNYQQGKPSTGHGGDSKGWGQLLSDAAHGRT